MLNTKSRKRSLACTVITLLVLTVTSATSGCLEEPMDKVISVVSDIIGGTDDPEGEIRKIDELVQEQIEEIVTEKVAEEVKTKVLGEGELGYDEGEMDTSASLGPKGHAVFFSIDKKLTINEIKIYGCRYDDFSRQFDIEIWDANFKTLYTASYDYTDYFPDSHPPTTESDFKWVTINIPNIEVDDDFYITLFTYSGVPSWVKDEDYRGGIEIGGDLDVKSSNSFVVDKYPNGIVGWPTTWDLRQDNTNWMIRVS